MPSRLILAMGEPMVEFAAVERVRLSQASTFVRGFGGDTSNLAVAVARLGGSAAYLSRVGDDEFGRALMELWTREGVDVTRVKVVAGAYTGVYFISWRPDGTHEFTYVRSGSAASLLGPEDLFPDLFREVAIFHTSGITQAISTSACDATFLAMELARRAGVLVSYDPNLRLKLWPLHRARALVRESVRQADVVFPSLEEARLISGVDDPDANLDLFLGLGARVVALKMGPEGCLVGCSTGERVRVPAVSVEVVDTGGAGDTFDAAFLVEWIAGSTLEACARFAAAASALTTTRVGCTTAIPHRSAVEQLLGGKLHAGPKSA